MKTRIDKGYWLGLATGIAWGLAIVLVWSKLKGWI